VGSKSSWWWYINTIFDFLGIIHRPALFVLNKNRTIDNVQKFDSNRKFLEHKSEALPSEPNCPVLQAFLTKNVWKLVFLVLNIVHKLYIHFTQSKERPVSHQLMKSNTGKMHAYCDNGNSDDCFEKFGDFGNEWSISVWLQSLDVEFTFSVQHYSRNQTCEAVTRGRWSKYSL
jgi:hypothetical protein